MSLITRYTVNIVY